MVTAFEWHVARRGSVGCGIEAQARCLSSGLRGGRASSRIWPALEEAIVRVAVFSRQEVGFGKVRERRRRLEIITVEDSQQVNRPAPEHAFAQVELVRTKLLLLVEMSKTGTRKTALYLWCQRWQVTLQLSARGRLTAVGSCPV